MTFTEVKELPRKRKKNLKYVFEDFMSLRIKMAKVNFDKHDYKDVHSAYSSFNKSVRNLGFPIDVTLIQNEVYFIRRDM